MRWEQLAGESAKAFAAFAVYRDLGAQRSISAAYRQSSGSAAAAAGTWNGWSTEHEWVARAEAYDKHLEQIRLAARDERLKRLEERRLDYEFANQDRLEQRVRKIEALLDKADAHPITDVATEKEIEDLGTATTTRTKTKVKGISLSGYARLAQEANDTASQAINGVRPDAKGNKAGGNTDGPKDIAQGILKGEFAWVKAEPSGDQ